MIERIFTLDGWQWRKYKTRDGRNAKIVYVNKSAMCVEINNKLFTSYELNGVVHIGLNNEIVDQLFDVPDQKEPKAIYILSGENNEHPSIEESNAIKYAKEAYNSSPLAIKILGIKNRQKVYLEENRWDS